MQNANFTCWVLVLNSLEVRRVPLVVAKTAVNQHILTLSERSLGENLNDVARF